MSASTQFEVAIAALATDEGSGYFYHLNFGTALEGTPFSQPLTPPNTARPEVHNKTFEGFIGGAGI